MIVAQCAFDRAKRVFHQSFALFDFLRRLLHALGHLFHQMLILFARDRAIGFVARALGFERALRTAAGAVIAQAPSQFIGAEAIGQFLVARTGVNIFGRIETEAALAKQTLGGVGTGVGLGHIRC